jgi:uncharacterized membrane protein
MNKCKHILPFVLVVLLLTFGSCNTYKWERKRYYKSNQNKNWNNYNQEKTKKQQEKEIDKYYKKY